MFFFRLYSKKTIFVGKDSSMDDKWNALEKYNLWGGNTYQLGLERKSYTDKIGNFGLSGNFWLVSFKISYLCLPLFYETRTTPSCHPSGCAYRQL